MDVVSTEEVLTGMLFDCNTVDNVCSKTDRGGLRKSKKRYGKR